MANNSKLHPIQKLFGIDKIKSKKDTVIKTSPLKIYLLPSIIGFLSFLIGLILFLPVNDLAFNYLSKLQFGNGNYIDIEDLNISLLGKINLDKPKLHLQAKHYFIEASNIEANISLLSLLFSKINASIKFNTNNDPNIIHIKAANQKLATIKNASWNINSNLENFNPNNIQELVGSISIDIKSGLVDYPIQQLSIIVLPKPLKKFLIKSIDIKLNIKNSYANIQKFYIQSDIFDIIIKGKIALNTSLKSNVTLKIQQLQKFYSKNLENGSVLKVFLTPYTKTDGSVEISCKGGFNSCTPIE